MRVNSINRVKKASLPGARRILLLNGLFLLVAGGGALILDLVAYFTGGGLFGPSIAQMPGASVGFVEAHGLAAIIGWLLLRAARQARVEPIWCATALAVHLLLGSANLVFWQDAFVRFDLFPMGVVTTACHLLFVLLEGSACGVCYSFDQRGQVTSSPSPL